MTTTCSQFCVVKAHSSLASAKPRGPEAARIVPHEVVAGQDWQRVPVRDHLRPLGLQYGGDTTLHIAFFSQIEYVL
jgi:hypothetical protein